MAIGKREQIVIGSISAIALIAALHFLIFAPSAASFKTAKSEREGMVGTIKGLRTINDPNKIKAYEDKTNDFLKKLETGAGKLQLEQPEPFQIPALDKIEPPADLGGKPVEEVKKNIQKDKAKEKAPAQINLIFQEIAKLRAAQANRASQTKLTFMGSANPKYGWMIPDQLPPTVAGGVLWDKLKNIAQFKISLNNSSKGSASYFQMERMYRNALAEIGLNLDMSASRAIHGQFVPLIQRMCYVDLIMDRLKSATTPPAIPGVSLTREGLMDYLSVELETEPLAELEESKAYFLYQELASLNFLISLAQASGVKEISAVQLRGYGFVREQIMPDAPDERLPTDITRMADDESDDPTVWMTAQDAALYSDAMFDPVTGLPLDPALMPVDPATGAPMGAPVDPMAAGGAIDPATGMPIGGLGSQAQEGPPKSKPNEKDLGFSVPIKVTFVAANTNGITYLYEILRQKPMAEVHRLILRSTSTFSPALTVAVNPTSSDIEMTATILFIPKLFKTLDMIQQAIMDVYGVTSATQGETPPVAEVPPTPAP